MEYININSKNSFDPTPKLKSSPVPISFISFNKNEDKCSYCGNEYSRTLLFYQKYCKNCLSSYIKNITDDNTYLDVHIVTNNTRCIEHEVTRNKYFCTNIREWCIHCSEILYFNQIHVLPENNDHYSTYVSILKDCNLCEKSIYKPSSSYLYYVDFKLCSDCYLISSGWVESTLAKKLIPNIYLSWWDAEDQCIRCCCQNLSFVSDCQKWCSDCFIIYTGCRYCLTTNIIFGPANQSQCRKCKRISIININITNISSGDHSVDEILYNINYDDCMNNVDFSHLLSLQDFYNLVKDKFKSILKPKMKWIPYSQIKNLIEIAKGGFGIIYRATLDGPVALKKIFNSQNMSKCFLNELKSLYQCYGSDYIIKYIGITQDPKTNEFMIIMDYAYGGDLHNYLQKDFVKITWKTKLHILREVSMGLESIHDKNFIHRDFHSGNILLIDDLNRWCIGDLGLSQPANNTSNNEMYGVIPYIAPEIFRGAAFSKESDIYGVGMIMWELTTGRKPFADAEHDINLIYKIIDGKRPEITSDTPECYANLMKRCWNSDPLRRPSINEIREEVCYWYFYNSTYFTEQFIQAERKRIELMQSKKLGPEFSEKPHPKAILQVEHYVL